MKLSVRDIPTFLDEDEEAEFWQNHDSADYLDWTAAKKLTFPELKPSLKSISIRLPQPMLQRIKSLANERDIPYQPLIKMILAEYLDKLQERRNG